MLCKGLLTWQKKRWHGTLETKSGQPETNLLTVHALLSLGSAMFFFTIFSCFAVSPLLQSPKAHQQKNGCTQCHAPQWPGATSATMRDITVPHPSFQYVYWVYCQTDTCTGLPHHQTGLLPKDMHTAVKALVNRRKRSSTIFFSHSGAKIAYSKISVCVFYHCMILYASFFLTLNWPWL